MILYVRAVWLCAVGCVVLIELCVLSLPGPAGTSLQSLDATLPGLSGQPPEQAPFLILALGLLLIGVLLGYGTERRLAPVNRLYRRLQKSYPPWYQRLPATRRELLLGLGLLGLLCALGLALGLLSAWSLWPALPLLGGIGLGLALPPILRLRSTLNEDRPEQPPAAVLHKIGADYSIERALLIGQIYLRLLLPVFSLFCILVLPMALGQLHLGPLETSLLLAGLFAGAFLGWRSHRESQLDFAAFRRNVTQLCALALLASAFLLFGAASGNLAELVLMSTFSGYLVALY